MSENANQTLKDKVKTAAQKITGKKVIVLGITGAIVVTASIAAVWFHSNTKGEMSAQDRPMFSVSGNNIMGEYVTASGTTSLGYTMDEFEPDYIETQLYIEEVYLSSGDEVEAGTSVLKVSEESIAQAKAELEEKKEETSLAYRAGLISYEQSKINAKYTYDTAVLEGEQAEAVYNNAVKEAEEKLQLAKDNVTETEANIEEYAAAYADYYYDYHLDTYKERYENNYIYYYTFLEEYGMDETSVGGAGMGGSSGLAKPNQVQGNNSATNNNGTENSGNSQPPEQNGGNSGNTGGNNNGDSVVDDTENNDETGDGNATEGGNGTEGETGGDGNGNGNETGGGGSGSETGGNGNGSGSETGGDGNEIGGGGNGSNPESGSGAGGGNGETGGNQTPTSITEEKTEPDNSQKKTEETETTTQQNSEEPLLLSLFTDSNKTLSRLKNSVSLGNGISLMSVSNSNQNNEDYTRRLSILQQMKSNMQTSQNYYYKAWDEYEAAADQANSQLKKLEAQIEPLRAELSEAETTYQLELIEAETTYKKSLAQTELAQSDYKAAIQKAEDELEALEDEKIEAEENLAEFEAILGDGYFYTKNSGIVMRMGTGSKSYLQGGSMVVAYRNEKDISVTVSVAQEDIHKLKVGDSAQVMIEDYGTFEGKITYLNPVSNSGSRTNITYEVIVDLQGEDMESLKENLTATVIFSVETER